MRSDLNIVNEVHHLLLSGVTPGSPERPDQALKIIRKTITRKNILRLRDYPNETIIASEHNTDCSVII